MTRGRGRGPAAVLVAGALLAACVGVVAGRRPLAGTGIERPPAIAGSWYPADPALARVEVHRLLRAAAGAPEVPGRILALLVPHAGWAYSGAAAAAAFRLKGQEPARRVVLVAPSHHGSFDGYAVDGADAYVTPIGRIPVDTEAIASLRDNRLVRRDDAVGAREHAVEIELPFLQETLAGFRLVPVLTGATTAQQEKEMAVRLKRLDDGQTIFVFSSDFTHYGPRFDYMPFGPTAGALDRIRDLDLRAAGLIASGDAEGFRSYLAETGNTVCGRAGLRLMLELLPLLAPDVRATLLGRYASGEIEGLGDDSSVSYLAMAFARGKASTSGVPLSAPPRYATVDPGARPLTEEEGSSLVDLARAALRTRLTGADDLSRALSEFPRGSDYERLQGVFVTLNRTRPEEVASLGRLRGCIGQIGPRLPLYEAVVQAAVGAALHDRRFDPVAARELEGLAVEVTVLSPRSPVLSPAEIRLGTHGVVIDKDGRSAVFLPQVPIEEGWTLDQTLTALARKAGLPPDAWRAGAQLSVFTAQVFKQSDSKERR